MSSFRTLRGAVIGLGTMGANHGRVLSEVPDVELVAVADLDPDRVARFVRGRTVVGYDDYRRLLEDQCLDFVVIAVPTRRHAEVACAAIDRRLHVLVEKPIAGSVHEARMMAARARSNAVILSVGHIERFNPAVIELQRRLSAGELGRIFQIDAERSGPFPDRIRDVGVVHDLAPHDIDVMQMLMGSPIARIFAETEQRVHTDFEDMLLATLRFANGVIGTLRVNWLSPRKVRTLSVLGENGQFLLDYGSQDLWYFAPSQNLWAPAWPVAGAGLPDVTARKYPVEKREPLRVELEAFVAAVREGLPPPVPAEAGIRALAIADLLVESGRTGRALTVPEAL